MKKLLKSILFFTIFTFLFLNIWNIFSLKDTYDNNIWNFKHFYETPENTIDVMFYGNSRCHCTINPSVLWEKYGISSFVLTGASRNIVTTYYSIEETLKTQKPKLLAVELSNTLNDIDLKSNSIYRNTITFKYSNLFLANINQIIAQEDQQNTALKFPIFHSRYTDLDPMDFNDTLYFNRGFCGQVDIQPIKNGILNISDKQALRPTNEIYLKKIIDLAAKEDIPLLFFVAPIELSYSECAMLNYLSNIAVENNIPFLNFNSIYAETDFDFSTDMSNTEHVNFYGARKISNYFADYINSNYTIENHKNDPNYVLWDLDAEYWQQKENKFIIGNLSFYEALNFATNFKGNYTFVISLYSTTTSVLPREIYEFMNKLNINISDINYNMVYVVSNGKIVYSNDYQSSWLFELGNSNYLHAKINSSPLEKQLIINNTNYLNSSSFANIIIYDNLLEEVIFYNSI